MFFNKLLDYESPLEKNFTRLTNLGFKKAEVLRYEQPAKKDLRDARDVFYRMLVLTTLGILSENVKGADAEDTKDFLKTHRKLHQRLSVEEERFLDNPDPTQEQILRHNWGYESAYALSWSLGMIPEMITPNQIINVAQFVPFVMEKAPKEVVPKLRTLEDLATEADYNLRLLWNVRNILFVERKTNIPHDYDINVLTQRVKAFNWLLGFSDEWDRVDTGT